MSNDPTLNVAASAYTDGDYDRLGTMKKAADVVYTYFRWVLDDHRRTMNENDHQARIKVLVHDTMAVFGLTDTHEQLARYFIANVLQGAQEVEFDVLGKDSWAPFNEDALREIYSTKELVAMFEDQSPHNQCMYAGRFMAECTSSLPVVEEIANGETVGCDLVLVQTVNWEILMEGVNVEDDGSFICVGKAIVATSQDVESAFGELHIPI